MKRLMNMVFIIIISVSIIYLIIGNNYKNREIIFCNENEDSTYSIEYTNQNGDTIFTDNANKHQLDSITNSVQHK